MSDLAKPYSVGSVYRFDLQRIGLTNEQIDNLSETDMLTIANKMQARYLQNGFWQHLEAVLSEVLQAKEEQKIE